MFCDSIFNQAMHICVLLRRKRGIVASEMIVFIMNILIAGRDTTACALSWSIYELTKNPQVEQKIVDEVNSICGTGDNCDFSYDTIGNLNYTDAVVMEVLRLILRFHLRPNSPSKTIRCQMGHLSQNSRW